MNKEELIVLCRKQRNAQREIREQAKHPIMEILVEREYKKKDYTIGKMYINGEYFCDTLEDTDRGLTQIMTLSEIKEVKEYGRTAIPTGRYQVAYTYSPRFKKHLPLLLNVPAFEGVRIHSGNTHNDTEGCILLGENKAVGKVLNSRKTMDEFLRILKPAIEACENIWITIR
jgi:hypothetical protein